MPLQDSRSTDIKDLPSLEKMVSEIKEEIIDLDDNLEADFKVRQCKLVCNCSGLR